MAFSVPFLGSELPRNHALIIVFDVKSVSLCKLSVASDTTLPSIVNYFIALSTQSLIILGNRNRGELMPFNVFTTFPVQDLRAAQTLHLNQTTMLFSTPPIWKTWAALAKAHGSLSVKYPETPTVLSVISMKIANHTHQTGWQHNL